MSQAPVDRELECRRKENAGGEPPDIPDELYKGLPEAMRIQVALAFARRNELRSQRAPAYEPAGPYATAAVDDRRKIPEPIACASYPVRAGSAGEKVQGDTKLDLLKPLMGSSRPCV